MNNVFIFTLTMMLQRPFMEILRFLHRHKKMPGSRVLVKGKRIYYEERGQGRPVLYIHGNTGSHEWYSEVMDIPGYRAIAPDVVNFGHSDPIESSDINVYADYVKGFMDELGIENCLVVGHSLGGAIAMSLATRYPGAVGKLLLVDSSPVSGLKTPEEYYPFIELYKVSRPLLKKAIAGTIPACGNKQVLKLLVNEAMLMNKSSYTGNARALEKADFTGSASTFGGPVLFIKGGLDPLITNQMAEETAEAFNGEYRIIENIGHSLMVENPGLFREVLLNFDD